MLLVLFLCVCYAGCGLAFYRAFTRPFRDDLYQFSTAYRVVFALRLTALSPWYLATMLYWNRHQRVPRWGPADLTGEEDS